MLCMHAYINKFYKRPLRNLHACMHTHVHTYIHDAYIHTSCRHRIGPYRSSCHETQHTKTLHKHTKTDICHAYATVKNTNMSYAYTQLFICIYTCTCSWHHGMGHVRSSPIWCAELQTQRSDLQQSRGKLFVASKQGTNTASVHVCGRQRYAWCSGSSVCGLATYTGALSVGDTCLLVRIVCVWLPQQRFAGKQLSSFFFRTLLQNGSLLGTLSPDQLKNSGNFFF
jgi:hypothetical protein